ncbi:MAG: cytochrome c oxidase subunit II, partial [Mycobacterium sp.]
MTPRGPGRCAGSRRFRLPVLAGTLGVLAITLSGCSWSEALGLGWPRGITPEADFNRQLWIGAIIA